MWMALVCPQFDLLGCKKGAELAQIRQRMNLWAFQVPACSERTVQCGAVPGQECRTNVTRRVAFLGLGMASVAAPVVVRPENSWALLPDDDDADLVQKAKASRQRKIQVCITCSLMWIFLQIGSTRLFRIDGLAKRLPSEPSFLLFAGRA